MKAIAERLVNAELNFLDTIEQIGGMSREDARKVFALYRKAKWVKLELGIGRYTVKNGAYLDHAMLRYALAEVSK